MYESTSFKTRRKHHFLLLGCLLATLINTAASMAMPVSCPEPCECYLNNNGLQSARCSEINPNQPAFPNIHVLVMRMDEIQTECNIPKNIHLILPQLNFVYMMNCSLSHIPVDTFKELEMLQEIDLSYNLLTKLDPSLFINNPKLSYANLQNNPFNKLPDRPFLISKSLKELDLTSCGIREITDDMFRNLTRLQYLMMGYNKLTIIEEETLPSGLKVLHLNNNLLNRIPMVELERLKKIRKVDLSQNPINCTCDEMNFVSVFSGRPVIFENEVQCAYPRQYRGYSIYKVPEQICYDQIGEGVDLPEGDPGDDEDDYSDPQTNLIVPEEKPDKSTLKKDDVQKYFERDQVVPVDKKSNIDYSKDEMQSDSVSDEGSGDGQGTDVPDTDEGVTNPPSTTKSSNDENNETNPGNTSPVVNPEQTPPKETVTEGLEPKTDSSTTSTSAPESEPAKPNEPDTEVNKPAPETDPTSTTEAKPEPSNPESTSTSQPTQETTKSVPDKPVDTPIQTNPLEHSSTEGASTPESSSTEKPLVSDTDTPEPTKPAENKTLVDSGISHALQKDNSDSSIFNFSYIIPCLAIIIVIIICLGVYLGQRSSHKNWEPATNNDGAELQDVSLLPDRSKLPIVKNKKYPSEENSEQTERLMNDGEASTPKSVWEHLEEPIGNGHHKQADSQLPNGQSIDKNEPIECAIVKVTTLPDSIPRTPLIRNT